MDRVGHFLNKLYIRGFAWLGSVEPDTGVLCETCQQVIKEILVLRINHGTHHKSLSSMRAAVETGCQICTCLWRHHSRNTEVDEFVPDVGWYFSNYKFRTWAQDLLFVVNGDFMSDRTWCLNPPIFGSEIAQQSGLGSYYSGHGNVSDASWSLANFWLSECLTNHTECRPSGGVQSYRPTRLIEIRSTKPDHELRLSLTSDDQTKDLYMTLSHCWGTTDSLRLTTSTLNRLRNGFAIAELPQTFQDAVLVTRRLNIRFLWIDALCILQDSLEDWQYEAARMSQVYQNSTCNISALDAHDSHGGLFFDHNISSIPYCTISYTRRHRQRQVYEVVPVPQALWADSFDYTPLNYRGWVLQERVLAPRLLHYGKKQLLWECCNGRACEFYPSIRSNVVDSEDVYSKDDFARLVKTLHQQSNHHDVMVKDSIFQTWKQLVGFYSRCKLTKSGDKLVAISGIVKYLQPVFKEDYLAGLWRGSLLLQLLWSVDLDPRGRSVAKEERPEYRAPSWSWASLDVPIKFSHLDFDGSSSLVTVVAAKISPITDDDTGQIKDGSIKLRGHLYPARIYLYTTGLVYGDVNCEWGQFTICCGVIPDVWPQVVEGLWLLPILAWEPHVDLSFYGLVLRPVVNKHKVYQRWGIFWVLGRRDSLRFGLQMKNRKLSLTPPKTVPEQVIKLI